MTAEHPEPAERRGATLVAADVGGTALFGGSAIVAAAWFTTALQWIAAIVAVALFVVGAVAFLWSFWVAVQRSRDEQLAVTQLYLHVGGIAPRAVRGPMLACLLAQAVIGLSTALARANDLDGSPGTSLALGVLVPMFGFGLNGLWSAYHADFEVRDAAADPSRSVSTVDAHDDADGSGAKGRANGDIIGKNGDHG